MIDVEKFIGTRKKLKISQVALSKGVCTQATLSKFENHQQIPAIDIMVTLCERLGLTLNDIFPVQIKQQKSKDVLSNVIIAMGYQNIERFRQDTQEIVPSKLGKAESNSYQLTQYFAAVMWQQDTDQAQKIITKIDIPALPSTQKYAFYAITLHYYLMINERGDAQKMFEDLAKHREVIISGQYSIFQLMTFYLLAQYQMAVKKHTEAMAWTAIGIDIASKNDRTYFLENLFWLLVEAGDIWHNQSFIVNEMIENARVIAKMHGNQEILDKVSQRKKGKK
ncbi:helix-turn-helix transcriptional regulator [Leuconostoc carnosum]|uniref:helix-turn-helix domain-containing protein n=1 Tax=Leuconostoc carnosum TaxID=1252 RepID=UPI00272E25A3|nr:helix-turn-helix transcriptional regulator [Leuconostoc carnosum]WLC98053.1 helix-turn-helix transcriptional regulator [Leuconostoc carnosum]